jgi:hypothetical protein
VKPKVSIEWIVNVGLHERQVREVEIETAAEIDAALDRIAAESDPGMPYVATVIRSDATLAISEGPGWSIVSFAFTNGDPPFHVSLGDRTAEGVVLVQFGGRRRNSRDGLASSRRWHVRRCTTSLRREVSRHASGGHRISSGTCSEPRVREVSPTKPWKTRHRTSDATR